VESEVSQFLREVLQHARTRQAHHVREAQKWQLLAEKIEGIIGKRDKVGKEGRDKNEE